MAWVGGFGALEGRAGWWLVKEQWAILVEGALVAFEASEIGAAPVQTLRRQRALAAHRLKRDGRTTPVKQGEECWYGRDVIALLGCGRLGEDQTRLRGQRAHQLEGPRCPVRAASGWLAVNGDEPLASVR